MSEQKTWQERFDKQFGKAGPEGNSDSIGRQAGCDDCYNNVRIREEHKAFVLTVEAEARRQTTDEILKLVAEYYAPLYEEKEILRIAKSIKSTLAKTNHIK